MFTTIRNWVTRLLLPIVWGRSHDHAARTLKKFGDTESDSGWQYLRAMEHTDDVDLQRMLFSNVMEEYRHSDYFYGAAHLLSSKRLHSPSAARKRLVQAPSDLSYFLAYAHECEHSIHGQFDTFASACKIPAVSDVFRRICSDEEEHEVQALDFLKKALGNARSRAKWVVFKAKSARMYESWMRGSQRIGDLMFGIILSVVFFSFGVFISRSSSKPRWYLASVHTADGQSAAMYAALPKRSEIG